MKTRHIYLTIFALVGLLGITQVTSASEPIGQVVSNHTNSTVAAGGYDVVAYRTLGKPVRGSGNHVATYAGATYLFINDEHKARFERNPGEFAPAYGGYCAYGVAVGKKFVGDPEVWKIVDGTLYLNLNPDIQDTWNKDVPGNIAKADKAWPRIRSKSPAEL